MAENYQLELEGVIVYVKSNHGKTKNYIKSVSQKGNDVSFQFTESVSEARPFEINRKVDIVTCLAEPFIMALKRKGKSDDEITEYVLNNFGADRVTISVKN